MYGENILRASFPGKKINPPCYFPLYPYPYVGQQSFLSPLAWSSGMGNEEKPGRLLQPGARGGLPGRLADRTRPEIGPREYGSERGRTKKAPDRGYAPIRRRYPCGSPQDLSVKRNPPTVEFIRRSFPQRNISREGSSCPDRWLRPGCRCLLPERGPSIRAIAR